MFELHPDLYMYSKHIGSNLEICFKEYTIKVPNLVHRTGIKVLNQC